MPDFFNFVGKGKVEGQCVGEDWPAVGQHENRGLPFSLGNTSRWQHSFWRHNTLPLCCTMISLRGNLSFLSAFSVLRWRYPARTHHLVGKGGGVHVSLAMQRDEVGDHTVHGDDVGDHALQRDGVGDHAGEGDEVGDHAGEELRLALNHLVAERGGELA